MKKVNIDQLRTTVKVIKRKEKEGAQNQENVGSRLPEHPEFRWSPGMVDGQGEVINPELNNVND